MKIPIKIFVLLSIPFFIGCSNLSLHKPRPDQSDAREILLKQIESAESFESKQYEIIEHTLQNGLNVLIVQKTAMPVVSVQVWYKVGSINETEGLKGIAHLFEHMMFRGSDNFAPQQHMQLIKETGGSCNAYTSDEVTVYHQKVPADKLALVLKLEADRMSSLKLNQDILNTERQVVMEEYRLRVDNNPIGSMERQLRQFLFPNHPYQFGPIGKMEDIAAFTVDDCKSFFESYYAPNNAVLVIAGNVQADQVIKMVESEFGSIASRPAPSQPDLSLDTSIARPSNKGQTDIPIPVTALTLYTAGERNEDTVVLNLIMNSLASGPSARLWRTLVREKKLAEFFVGSSIQGQENGVIFFACAHLPFMSGKVKAAILQELENVKSNGLKESEFLKARNQLSSQLVFQKYHVDSLARSIGYYEVVRGDYRTLYELTEKLNAVTQDDIIRVANKYFTDDNIRTMYFKPKEGIFLADIAGLFKSIFY